VSKAEKIKVENLTGLPIPLANQTVLIGKPVDVVRDEQVDRLIESGALGVVEETKKGK
jgi:lysophospholipid acyltransferase (LPLAT)-like uncharacterized protein